MLANRTTVKNNATYLDRALRRIVAIRHLFLHLHLRRTYSPRRIGRSHLTTHLDIDICYGCLQRLLRHGRSSSRPRRTFRRVRRYPRSSDPPLFRFALLLFETSRRLALLPSLLFVPSDRLPSLKHQVERIRPVEP